MISDTKLSKARWETWLLLLVIFCAGSILAPYLAPMVERILAMPLVLLSAGEIGIEDAVAEMHSEAGGILWRILTSFLSFYCASILIVLAASVGADAVSAHLQRRD